MISRSHLEKYRENDRMEAKRASGGGGTMSIPQIMERMIDYSHGNIHDIDHLTHVWAYARTIGALEGLDRETLFLLETAAITHDIACPLCREIYGSADGRHQEQEGPALVRAFLVDSGMTPTQIERVAYLVGHHHTVHDIDGMDYQILIEADYIVNACESGYDRAAVEAFIEKFMGTESGKRIARSVLIADGR